MNIKPDKVKEAKKAARDIIGEPSRSRKRGPHQDKRKKIQKDLGKREVKNES